MKLLAQKFYKRDTVVVARDLLGKLLVREIDGALLAGIISETEAYRSDDPASHSFRGKTQRNSSMFGPVGHAYVYFSYGLHNCLNIVSRDTEKYPAGGVLIRSVIPVANTNIMAKLRHKPENYSKLAQGPGNVTQAFNITRNFDGVIIYEKTSGLYIVQGVPVDQSCIEITSRIGISKAREKLWRFTIDPSCKAELLEEITEIK